MRQLFFLLFLILISLVISPVIYARESVPSRASIQIAAPSDESIVNGKVDLQFNVQDFSLSAKPSTESGVGVVALYLDGKFYTNTATSSASLQLPTVGTHRIDAELVSASRRPVIPSATVSLYVHNQKKTPYLFLPTLGNGAYIYTPQPTLPVLLRNEQYEDLNTYYQVFIDGVVDGDSLQSLDRATYVLRHSLSPGRHTLRIALYSENGRPYSPPVTAVREFTYVAQSPIIRSIDMPENISANSHLEFKAIIDNFKIPENGFLTVEDGQETWLYDDVQGGLSFSKQGVHTLLFRLVDLNGVPLIPTVEARKNISVGESKLEATGAAEHSLFFTADDGIPPQWGLIALAVIQGGVILGFATVLMLRHRT